MLKLLVLGGALVAISAVMSTRAQRAEAREWLKPVSRGAWIATGLGWLFILWPWGNGR